MKRSIPLAVKGALLLLAGVSALLLSGCPRKPEPPAPPPLPRLSVEEVTALIPSSTSDRRGWAEDVLAAFEAHALWPDAPSVCSVLAVVEQESGYVANPTVPKLASIVRAELEERLGKLGILKKVVLGQLLSGKAPGAKLTFDERLDKVRTEKDLDVLYRELLAHYRLEFPNAFNAANAASELSGKGALEALNPITTAGSMQVAVDFAHQVAKEKGRPEWSVRDELYTRRGGLEYGTARLLGYPAGYELPLYRFADYNAGFYASRNAALQKQVSVVTGIDLVTDGDFLIYDQDDKPSSVESNTLKAVLRFRERFAPDVSEWTVRRDLRKEKEKAFEETDTYAAIRREYEKKTGKSPEYAQLPDVAIESPKMKAKRSTAWFARSVNGRFERCMGRLSPKAAASR